LSLSPVRRLAASRGVRFGAQMIFVLLFGLVIVAGLVGTSIAAKSFATVGTWMIWWIGVIFLILCFGKVWCYVCPWNALAEWTKHGALWGVRLDAPGEAAWPRRWRNLGPAIAFFLLFVWLELGVGLTMDPLFTAVAAVLLLTLTVVSALVYRRAPFCRYACPVGRISGLYALFAPVELRARDRRVCRRCRSKDCLTGNQRGYGCPTGQYPGTMDRNTYCILCLECVKTCPRDNLALNLRPFGADLVKAFRARGDEAYLALVLLSLVIFHAVTMVPPWFQLVDLLEFVTGWGYTGAFSLLMAVMLAVPLLAHRLATGIGWRLARERGVPRRRLFVTYAYAMIPLALFFHLAHNTMHLAMEFAKVVPVLSDPLGMGWNLFGTAGWIPPASLLPLSTVHGLQELLLGLGIAASAGVLAVCSRRLYPPAQAVRAAAPMLVVLGGYLAFGWWLFSLPMAMRMLL
jgi:polyferredoxin